jgi:uncharacterized membrane protein YphA (DoxX/SURF4 family)
MSYKITFENIIVNISRFLVGVLFIFSGLIKINDPVGFSFKLEEYFGPTVFDLNFILPFVLPLAIVIVVVEVLLGVALLIGFKKKFTIYSLLAMIVFFTFLTFYSAYFNVVTDCGCFGDAIKLTPWESFTKDIILLILILAMMIGTSFKTPGKMSGLNFIKPIFSIKILYIIILISTLSCVLILNQVLSHLPILDFRPYKVGNNIIENMIIPDGAKQDVFQFDWLFKVNGQEKIISTNGNYPTVEGEFISVETKLIETGYEPPIHDLTMEFDNIDYTEELMGEDKLLIFVLYNLSKSNTKVINDMKYIREKAINNNYKVIALTASGDSAVSNFSKNYQVDLDFYFCDETALKTIVRSNPAALKLNNGNIIQKVHWNDFDLLQFN